MEYKHDSRPFIDLQKDAEEFKAKFEKDIEMCKSILDSKITNLICDPDSIGNSLRPKQNALVEFSKAKYDIYISMKGLMNDMEREWLKYISEMKKLFIDNVEVFLANTKLEVKLPSSTSWLSSGPRKSLGSKSTSVTSTICPIINSITKNIPGFTQNKSIDLEMEKNEVEMASSTESDGDEDIEREKSSPSYDNSKHRKNPSPARKPNSPHDVPEPSSRYGRKGRYADEKKQINVTSSAISPVRNITIKDSSSSESQEENDAGLTIVNSRKPNNRSSSRSKSATISKNRNYDSDENEEIMETETSNNNNSNVSSRARRKPASKSQANTKILEEETVTELEGLTLASERRRGRTAGAKNAKNIADETSSARGRPTRRKTMNRAALEREIAVSQNTVTTEPDIADISDTEAYVAQPPKSSRRKTLLPNAKEVLSGADIIPGIRTTTTRSKRKTIGGVSDLMSVAPSKRLKSSNIQKIITESDEAVADDNLLEINDSYSQWISLKSIDGKIPTSPGIYEVKVWRAKKAAFIGCCDSLRQKMTVYKLKQNSFHKRLDNFIARNYDDIQIRYEIASSVNDAKVEAKNRIDHFVAIHKTTPAYN